MTMTAEELLNFYVALSELMLADPMLSLALVTSTFDPVGICYDHDFIENADGEHPATVLMIARRTFPDIYADACQQLSSGISFETVAIQAANRISQDLGGLDTYGWEGFYWGIPLPAYGVDWEQSETDQHYARLLAAFDRASASNLDDLDYYVARLVMDSLSDRPDWRNVTSLLGHFFSATGNSCIDFTWETMAELEPLSWEKGDVELARTVIHEANDILRSARDGLVALEDSGIFHALQGNVRRLRRQLEHITRHHLENNYELPRYLKHHPPDIEWPDPA